MMNEGQKVTQLEQPVQILYCIYPNDAFRDGVNYEKANIISSFS